jgi:hypothetical protein
MSGIFAERPTPEMYGKGKEIDCQCARCGSSMEIERCNFCEDGMDGHDCGEPMNKLAWDKR